MGVLGDYVYEKTVIRPLLGGMEGLSPIVRQVFERAWGAADLDWKTKGGAACHALRSVVWGDLHENLE